MKEAAVNLLQLNPVEVATQLMVEDFTIFRQIEATEYIDDLFEIKSRYGTPSLTHFCELVSSKVRYPRNLKANPYTVLSPVVYSTNLCNKLLNEATSGVKR